MDLHELFDSVLDELPPMPDQTAAAAESLRRRRIQARYGLTAAACALVVGAGTIALDTPWRHDLNSIVSAGPVSDSDSAPAHQGRPPSPVPFTPSFDPAFALYQASMIQSVWPVAGIGVTWDESRMSGSSDTSIFLDFKVGGSSYVGSLNIQQWAQEDLKGGEDLTGRIIDKCYPSPPVGESSLGWSCTTANLPGGAVVMVEHYSTDGKTTANVSVEVELFHGLDSLDLYIDGHATHGITDSQFIALAESPAYQQLFAKAQQRHLFGVYGAIDAWGG